MAKSACVATQIFRRAPACTFPAGRWRTKTAAPFAVSHSHSHNPDTGVMRMRNSKRERPVLVRHAPLCYSVRWTAAMNHQLSLRTATCRRKFVTTVPLRSLPIMPFMTKVHRLLSSTAGGRTCRLLPIKREVLMLATITAADFTKNMGSHRRSSRNRSSTLPIPPSPPTILSPAEPTTMPLKTHTEALSEESAGLRPVGSLVPSALPRSPPL